MAEPLKPPLQWEVAKPCTAEDIALSLPGNDRLEGEAGRASVNMIGWGIWKQEDLVQYNNKLVIITSNTTQPDTSGEN